MDDELWFYVHFNCISVISGQWKGKHERPCAMKRRLASERISPSAGFESETPWSDFESAKSSAMLSLLVRSRKQAKVTLTTMPIIWTGTKTICPFLICGLADGWGSGYNESVMFCFFDYFVHNRWYKWYKNHKNFIQHLVLITVDYAPIICNHSLYPPYTHTQTENIGDNGFSSITALGPAERHSPALYNNKFNGIYMHNITSPAAGELKRRMSRTLAPLSPAHPRRCMCWAWGGGGGQCLQMAGALRIKLPKFRKVKKRSSRLNVHLMFPLFPANRKSIQ